MFKTKKMNATIKFYIFKMSWYQILAFEFLDQINPKMIFQKKKRKRKSQSHFTYLNFFRFQILALPNNFDFLK